MVGKLRDLTINRDGTQNITVTVSTDFRPTYDGLAGVEVDVEIKKHRKHRSLDANGYAWVLIDRIAAATGSDKITVPISISKIIRVAMIFLMIMICMTWVSLQNNPSFPVLRRFLRLIMQKVMF